MKRAILTLICFSFLYCSLLAQTTYTLISTGFWETSTIWSPTGVPGVGDVAIIDGETVYVRPASGHVQVDSILMVKQLGSNNSGLIVDENAQLTVRSFHMKGEDVNKDILFQIYKDALVTVTETFHIERTSDNSRTKVVQIYITEGQMDVNGDFIVDYGNSDVGESNNEIYLLDTAQLNIGGNLYLNIFDGDNLGVYLNRSAGIQVNGDLLINSDQSLSDVYVQGYNTSTFEVDGDITFQAKGDDDAKMTFGLGSELKIGGTFTRPTNFGKLSINDSATLIYDGNSPQTIACDTMPNAGTDVFNITNVTFANTSGSPMGIAGDLTVTTHMDFTSGVIQTTDTTLLIIEDGATIGAGNSTAYVDGPIMKKGSTNGNSFVFPLGNNGVYAPLEISEVTNATHEYQAQYFSDPPPIEDGISPPLEKVSGSGYWSLAKGAGADDIGVSLHWADAAASGINDPDSLLVAGLKDNGATKTWESYGNGGTTGGTGSGVGGSVTTALAEPPPLDDVTLLTIGTINAGSNALPVTLTRFGAVKIGEEVQLEWETVAEEGADRFIIERSSDGKSFVELDQIAAHGSSSDAQYYSYRDMYPQDGVNYYRLRQVDYDNRFAYSEIVSIQFYNGKNNLQVYPNPLREQLTVQGFSNSQKEILLTVKDQLGRQLYSKVVPIESGKIEIESAQLQLDQRGVYFLQLGTGDNKKNIQILKIK